MPHLNYNLSFGSICLFLEIFYLVLFFLTMDQSEAFFGLHVGVCVDV